MNFSALMRSETLDRYINQIPFLKTASPSVQDPSLPQNALNERMEGILMQTFKNPLFKAASALTAFVTLNRGTVGRLLYSPMILPAIGIGAIPLSIVCYQQRKHLWYEISLTYIVIMKILRLQSWYDVIHPDVMLGAIPLHNQFHEEELTAKGIGAVLSLLEDHEAVTSSFMSEPVLCANWRAHKIEFLRIPIPDLSPPSLEMIDQAVEYIAQKARENKITYVHCKAGRGRSATVVICYLLKYYPEVIKEFSHTPDMVKKAIAFVRQRRPQIYLTDEQEKVIRQYYERLNKSM